MENQDKLRGMKRERELKRNKEKANLKTIIQKRSQCTKVKENTEINKDKLFNQNSPLYKREGKGEGEVVDQNHL